MMSYLLYYRLGGDSVQGTYSRGG